MKLNLQKNWYNKYVKPLQYCLRYFENAFLDFETLMAMKLNMAKIYKTFVKETSMFEAVELFLKNDVITLDHKKVLTFEIYNVKLIW